MANLPQAGPLATFGIAAGSRYGEQIPVPAPVVTVGRAAGCEVLIDDDSVSARHARLEYDLGGWRITDLSSINGTAIEGVKLAADVPTPLPYGATVRFGGVKLQFRQAVDVDVDAARAGWVEPEKAVTLKEERRGFRLPLWLAALVVILLALVAYAIVQMSQPAPRPLPEPVPTTAPAAQVGDAVKVTWEVAGATDVGRVRSHNEDSFLVDAQRGVFLVADGMGGHAAGEIASAIASEAVGAALRQGVDGGLRADDLGVVMRECIHQAHLSILNYSATKPETRGMGTTMTALVVCEDGAFRVGHIGDSRCYVLRDGELQQLSRDHTWVQREVDEGRLTTVGARRHRLAHVLTRALGVDSLDEPDVYAGTLLPGDLVLLGTDGLSGMLTDRLLRRILIREAELHELVADLIVGANERGGRDNITAVLVKVLAAD